jgi:hypothetical protein
LGHGIVFLRHLGMRVVTLALIIITLHFNFLSLVELSKKMSLVRQRFISYNKQAIIPSTHTAIIPTAIRTTPAAFKVVKSIVRYLALGLIATCLLYVPVNQISLSNLENMEPGESLMVVGMKSWVQAAGAETWLLRFVLVMILVNSTLINREVLETLFMRAWDG